MLTHLSLFTGIGGLDIAAEAAGFEAVGQCEWADYPTKVLEKHWPDIPRWRDIRTLTKESYHAETQGRAITVISGGFPCQPFSVAGSRKGILDDRYLWPEMLRVIDELRPSWVIGENVAGILSMAFPDTETRMESRAINRLPGHDLYEAVFSRREKMLLPEIIRSLEQIGYEVQVFVIPACGVGAWHQRYRTAIIGYRTDAMENTRCGGLLEQGVLPQQPWRAEFERTGEVVPDAARERCGKARTSSDRCEKRVAVCGEDVADTDNTTPARQREHGRKVYAEPEPIRSCGSGLLLSDTNGQRLQIARPQPGFKTLSAEQRIEHSSRRPTQPRLGGMADGIPAWMDEYWEREPNIPRVATNVPNRADRLKGLGNAVYWRQFYPIFKAIADIERSLHEH